MSEYLILIPIIVFLGYLVGYVIKYFTQDELKAGKKWFVLMQKTLLVLLAIGCLYYVKLSWMLVIGVLIGFFSVKYLKIYFYFGILSVLSLMYKNYLIVINSLMFLFGLPYGTMKKDVFVFLFFLGFLLFAFSIDLNLLFGICCGAFIRQYYLTDKIR